MSYIVYIIENEESTFYKGFTTDLQDRMFRHNNNLSTYTAEKGPWQVIFIKEFAEKRTALKYENMLKRQNHRYLRWLLDSEENELGDKKWKDFQ